MPDEGGQLLLQQSFIIACQKPFYIHRPTHAHHITQATQPLDSGNRFPSIIKRTDNPATQEGGVLALLHNLPRKIA